MLAQLGHVQLARHDQQGAVAHKVVVSGGALGVFAVFIAVDALAQEIVDVRAAVLAIQQMPAVGQRRADCPAVVGRVEAQIHHGVRRAVQVAPHGGLQRVLRRSVTGKRLQHLVRRAQIVHAERAFAGIVKIGLRKVDRAVRVLMGNRIFHGQPRALKQPRVAGEFRFRRVIRFDQLLRHMHAADGQIQPSRHVPERAAARTVRLRALQFEKPRHVGVQKSNVCKIVILHDASPVISVWIRENDSMRPRSCQP